MLSRENNELLCRVGPGTPMGEVFRRFWNPICLTSQVPLRRDPLRVEILGEYLVAFRNAAGEIGLLPESCMHRGVSLALGRVEEDGIRCLYHGWKYAIDGTVIDLPNALSESRRSLRSRSYPVREAGGLVWAYLGPPDKQPPFPNWPFFKIPVANMRVNRIDADVNYMQQLEGGTDPSHVGILHTNFARPGWDRGEFSKNPDADNPAALWSADLDPVLDVEDTEFGFHYAAIRELPGNAEGLHNVRVVPVVMPSTRIIPSVALQFLIFEVPMNDTRTATFGVTFRPDGGPVDQWKLNEASGRHDPALFCEKTHRYLGSWNNAFGQARENMDRNWSGIHGVVMEDMAMSMTQGPIVDRSVEHLVAADKTIVRARQQLLESARRVMEGGDPIGVHADLSNIAGCDRNVAPSTRWQDLVPGHAARRA